MSPDQMLVELVGGELDGLTFAVLDTPSKFEIEVSWERADGLTLQESEKLSEYRTRAMMYNRRGTTLIYDCTEVGEPRNSTTQPKG